MRVATIAFAAVSMLLATCGAIAQNWSAIMLFTSDDIKWAAQSPLSMPGLEWTTLTGNLGQPGPYTVRFKFPAGFKIAPHTHSDTREITVLSGTWYLGYGDTADPTKLKALPAGSYYTEPAGVPHYIFVFEPVVIQVSGTGPSLSKY